MYGKFIYQNYKEFKELPIESVNEKCYISWVEKIKIPAINGIMKKYVKIKDNIKLKTKISEIYIYIDFI